MINVQLVKIFKVDLKVPGSNPGMASKSLSNFTNRLSHKFLAVSALIIDYKWQIKSKYEQQVNETASLASPH